MSLGQKWILGVSFALVVLFWYLSFVTKDKPKQGECQGRWSLPLLLALQHAWR